VIKTLIMSCWSENPEQRPSFDDILKTLDRIHFQVVPGVNAMEVRSYIDSIEKQRKKG
jgi:hypothetical protein